MNIKSELVMNQDLFESISILLEHIKVVQTDVIEMTKDSYLTLSTIFAKFQDQLPDEALESLQYQDIVSQQLTAIVEAIDMVQKNIEYFTHSNKEDSKMVQENIEKLSLKLDETVEKARAKRDAFSGKVGHSESDDIEFF